jgi:hypothetical protein
MRCDAIAGKTPMRVAHAGHPSTPECIVTLEDLERAVAHLKKQPAHDWDLPVGDADRSPAVIIVCKLRHIAALHVDAARKRRHFPSEDAALPAAIPDDLRSEVERLPQHHEQEAVARYMAAIDDVREILEALPTG